MFSSRTLVAVLVTTLPLCATQAAAQSAKFPNKPIRWIVPFAAGGGTDVVARPIAIKLGEVLGQQIVYDNRGGGGGLIAAELVAKSAPDGYTQLVASPSTHVFAQLLNEKLPYDPVKDFAPITKLVTGPLILVANPAFPARTIKDLVAYAKANPGKINWASSGNGAGGHLALELMKLTAGIDVVHVPFKGAGLAANAVIAGECDLVAAQTGVFLQQIRAGKLNALAVAGSKRLALLPDVPRISETPGLPDFEVSPWYGLLAPAGTPQAVINLIHDEVVKILDAPESVTRLAADGTYAVTNTPAQFAAENRAEVARWSRVFKAAGIKAE